MLPLLDRYILREIFRPFLIGLIAFTAMLAGTSILFNLVGDVVRNGIPWVLGLEMFLLRIPAIVVPAFPMATVLAVLLALGRLAGDSEITALLAGGISIVRISRPVLIFGAVVSILTFVFNEWVVPKTTYYDHQIYFRCKN